MWIKSLECRNFRNYSSLSIDFDKGTNLLYGDNAQGKTNIIEAVYICSSTRSNRGSKDKEIIKFGEEEAHIRVNLYKKEIPHKIDIHFKKNQRKGAAIDGFPIKKAVELLGYLNVVLFAPEDLYIVKNGPSERRKFIDRELCQIDPVYMNDLSRYNKILENRNRLLKDISFNKKLEDTLDVWDEQLVIYGTKIIEERNKFLSEINEIMIPFHRKITGNIEDIVLRYEPGVNKDVFMQKMIENRERDKITQQTNAGPHRDDFSIISEGIDLKTYGSQGQIRSGAISLKLAEIYLIKERSGEYPVLLLDDVMSELDSHRQEYLLEEINKTQTIITGTGIDGFFKEGLKIDRKYFIKQGTAELID